MAPLQLSISRVDLGAAKVLIEAGASLEAAGESNVTALEFAVLANEDMVKSITEATATLEAAGGGIGFEIEIKGENAAVFQLIFEAEAARKEARDRALRSIRDALGA